MAYCCCINKVEKVGRGRGRGRHRGGWRSMIGLSLKGLAESGSD